MGAVYKKTATKLLAADASQPYATFRLLAAAELQPMEGDLHQHIHLENNILFPWAVELEGVPGGKG